jgi:hypothetical protein
MAHFAKLNDENIVIAVHVVNNQVILKADGTESELKGKQFLNSLHGNTKWVQTSYNGNFRKNYAGIGFTYDSERDAFIAPQPFNSWLLNENTCLWEAPVQYPNDGNFYQWNEQTLSWEQIIIEQ